MLRGTRTSLVATAVSGFLLSAFLVLNSASAAVNRNTSDAANMHGESLPVDPIRLTNLSCTTSVICTAVGIDAQDNGAIFRTSNSGVNWEAQSVASGTPFPYSISCPTIAFCLAKGVDANISIFPPVFVETDNGGGLWTTYPPTIDLGNATTSGATCASPTSCYLIESSAAILRSTDLGVTWKPLPRAGFKHFNLLSCVRASACFTVGTGATGVLVFGRIAPNGTSVTRVATMPYIKGFQLLAMSCSTSTSCAVAGGEGTTVLTTADGGAKWAVRSLPESIAAVLSISCADAKVCVIPALSKIHKGFLFAATTRNGGATWSISAVASEPNPDSVGYISCPSSTVCFVSGSATPESTVYIRSGFTSKWVREIIK